MKNENSTLKLFTSVKSLLLKALLLFAIFNLGSAQLKAQCPTPTGLSNGLISATSATINWNNMAGAIYYKIRYRVQTPVGAWVNTTSTPNTKFIVGLTQNTAYEYQVKSVCNSIGNESGFSSTGTFTTGAQCIVPTNLAIVSSTATTTTLSWTGVGSWYSTRYRTTSPLGSWVYGSSVPTSKIFVGLTPNTSYEFQVASNCTSDPLQSPFSASLIVNTFCSSYASFSNSISACDSYTWSVNGATYTNSGTYKDTNTTCQINTLNLTINNSSTSSSSATACDTYTWSCNGATYTASGAYTCTSMNAAGCVNTATLNLTINNSSTSSTSAAACDTYTWLCNGTVYTASGTYTCTSMNVAGCVHTETLNLDIHTLSLSATSTDVTCFNGSDGTATLTVNGTGGTSSGTINGFTGPYAPSNWAPDFNLITIYGGSNGTINGASAPGSLIFNTGNQVSSIYNPNYYFFGINQPAPYNGTISFDWAVPNIANGNHEAAVFSNGSIIDFFDPMGMPSGSSSFNISAGQTFSFGIGSLASGSLVISNFVYSYTGSNTYTYNWSNSSTTQNQTGLSAGTYSVTVTDGVCTATTSVMINEPAAISSSYSATACDSYVAPWGTTYTTSGSYTHTYTTLAGCDSVNTCNLTINNSTAHTTYETACDSYTWSCNSATYTNSGTWTCTSMNAAGCVHTETLDLTINNSTAHTTFETACDSYTWSCNSATYTNSGTWTCTSMNAAGCVHTETLDLTINNSTAHTTYETACDSYTWSCNSATYTNSGTWTCTSMNAAGCVHTETLDLTINNSTAHTTYETACDSYTWSCNSATYTNSGTWTCTSLNAAGCVHTETLDLTINNSTAHTTYETACDSYTWSCNSATYTNSGTWTCTSINAAGCLHTETLNLVINALPTVTASDVSGCPGSSVPLVGNPAGGTFSIANPYLGSSTTYTYTYTDANGCTNTSSPALVTVNLAVPIYNFAVSQVTGSTVLATWTSTPGVTWYQLRYKPVSSSTWSPSITQSAPTNQKYVTGLNSNTQYEIQIKGFCGSNVTGGPWTTSAIFTTDPPCNTPTGLTVSNITNTNVTLSWNPAVGAAYYGIRYKKTSASVWTMGTSTPTMKLLTGLTPGAQYEFQVQSYCGTPTPGPYTASIVWTQATTIPPTAGGKIVGTEEELISNVNIYPNPTSNVLNIDLMVTESSNTIIKVLDMSGRLIKQTQVKSEKGLNPITIDLSELASGIYALQILENEKVTHISKVEKK